MSHILKKHHNHQQGFTLIEILMALMIFAIIAVITSSVLYHVFNTRERINQHAKQLASLQLAIILLQRDFQQSCNRPINSPEFQLKPAFSGTQDYVEFTTSGEVNPLATLTRSSLRRVAYFVEKKRLIRRSWNSLDRVTGTTSQDKVLLSGVSHAQFNYLDDKLAVKSMWDESDLNQSLPVAIQMNLNMQQGGKMSLLFQLPAGGTTRVSSS